MILWLLKALRLGVRENETLQQQTNGQQSDFERLVDSVSQNQVIEENIDDKIRKAGDNRR